ncbi:MAG: 50S ribosomal protein L30 [Candidatus Altiarchaeota archaeon]|nr:50S ribosomal protein L30 [Candidatus Altiarchaeota archaeon]
MDKKKDEGGSKIAVVRIRGPVDVTRTIADTLSMLNLKKVNHCVLIDNRPTYTGMLKKVKDFVTWGEINEKTFTVLLEKWGRTEGYKKISKELLKEKGFLSFEDFTKKFFAGKAVFSDIGLKPVFKLHPPSGGYERAGIKRHVNIGGALGYRGDRINELMANMGGFGKKNGSKG